jgi:hypothetical protein
VCESWWGDRSVNMTDQCTDTVPCPCAQCADSRNARDHQNAFVISAPHHHNAMGLEEALKECDTFVSEDDIPWSKIADKHGVARLGAGVAGIEY